MNNDMRILEHLKMIEAIIARMNRSSSTTKNFLIAVYSGVLLFSLKERCLVYVLFLALLIVIFAMLDMYYLWQERLFKELYKKITKQKQTDFSMDRSHVQDQIKKIKLPFSISIYPFYSGLLLITLAAFLLIGGYL